VQLSAGHAYTHAAHMMMTQGADQAARTELLFRWRANLLTLSNLVLYFYISSVRILLCRPLESVGYRACRVLQACTSWMHDQAQQGAR
jgi:hypothetical protein